jgi:hypothetical protein
VSSSPFPIGTGPSLLVGDLVPGTRIDCAIIAANGAGVAGAASKPVTVAATKPRLGLRIDPGHSVFASDPGPRITPAVGTGGRNVCTPGRWMHWPTRYTFGWYSSPRPVAKAKGRRVRWLSGSRTLVVPRAAAGRYLFCRVVAANGAGATTAFSNVYRVPRATPVARGAVHLMVETPSLTPVLRWDPRTSYSTPLHDNQFRFSCARPTFDRRVGVSYEWQIRNVGTDVPRFDLVFDRSVLKVGVGRVASGAPPPAVLVDDIRIPQMLVGDWTIQCIVAARRHGMEALAFSDLVHVNTDVTR